MASSHEPNAEEQVLLHRHKATYQICSSCGRLTAEEAAVLQLLNEKRDDHYIMDALAIDKNRLQALEKNVGTKTACAILHAIDFCIQFDPI